MKRAGFEEVARLARPNGRGNRNAATVTSEFTIKIISRLRTLGQPLAALLLYGCRIPLADVKVCDAFYSHCPFSYNFSFARAYNSRVREKLKGMVTIKEKDNIRHGDVDDMIFGSEAHVSER